MTDGIKKKLGVLAGLVVLVAVLLCGCQSTEDKLIGCWEKVEGSGGLSYLEFFSDGTYCSDHPNYEGGYSVEGDRIKLSGILMEAKVYTFEIKDNVLNLYLDSGDLCASYKKN